MNEKKVPLKQYQKFQHDYFQNPGHLRYGQAFASLFYPDHSCMNGCTLESIYYTQNTKHAQDMIFDYIDWTN